MRVVIFGAAGNVGQAIIERALNEGHEVVAFARTPSKIKVTGERLTLVPGDVRDAAAVAQALTGADAAISAIGPMTTDPSTDYSEAVRILVAGLEQQQVKRLAAVMSVGLFFPQVDPQWVNVIEEQRRAAEVFRASSLTWVGICPPFITDAPYTGQYQLVAGGPAEGGQVSKHHIAEALLQQVTNPIYAGQLVGIAG